MNRIIGKVRTIGYYFIALLVVAAHPFVVMADTPQATTSSTVSAPSSTTPPPTTPTTVTTNPPSSPAPSTVSPTATSTATPTVTPAATTPTTSAPDSSYTYDPTTKKWSNNQWQYNPATGTYEAVQPTVTPLTSTSSPTTSPASSTAAPLVTTPTTSSSTTPTTPTTQSTTNASTTASLLNALTSTAATGNAGVLNNTAAGNATSGNAAAAVTLVNQVNSSLAADSNQKVVQFTKNIMGDVNGDITLYPLLLKAMLEQKAGDPTASTTVNSSDQLNATNTVGVTAQSGAATVSGNTSAGNATSGSADAVANVVNILNSMIATQQSFIGTINIYGNLNGDILVAPDFIPQMLANNAPSSATPTDTSTNVSSSDTQSIVNNISAIANSGAASVLNNTTSGSATTGAANTNVLLFNLTGHQVIAKDSILVFVNVLGHWVGMIVGAPAGATSAMIADGVTQNQTSPDLTVNAAAVHGITNNITVAAKSGDATVSDNTKAGNATSGNASAAVNLANISNSDLSFSGWFGIIFINVFQNWFGSFGIDTPYGNPVMTDAQSPSAAPTAPIQFVPHTSNTVKTHAAPVVLYDSRLTNTQGASNTSDTSGVVLASANVDPSSSQLKLAPAKIPVTATAITNDYRLWVVVGSVTLMGVSALGLRRLLMH